MSNKKEELSLDDIIEKATLFKKGEIDLDLKQIILYSGVLMGGMMLDMDNYRTSKNAGKRARNKSLLLEKLFLSFRKLTV